MGLFSSKTKIEVNVTVQKLFEEAQIPDSARQGLIKGVMGGGDVVENMLEEITGSLGIRANTARGWAKRNNYYFGLPTAGFKSNIDARSVVMNVIANNIGKSIEAVYYTMAPMNSFHYAWAWITNVHGYNANSNELVALTAVEGKKCYLKNMLATYTQESYDFMVKTNDLGMLDQLGPAPSSGYTPSNPFTAMNTIGEYSKQPSYEVSSVAVEDYITVTYEFEEEPGVFIVRGLTLAMTAVEMEADFHQARYVDEDGKTGFFTYKQGSGTYPVIDEVMFIDPAGLGSYYPWVYFRANGEEVALWNDKKAVKDCRKYCDYLGVNYDLLNDKVQEEPDVIDVQQSMLMFGLTPGEQNPACIEYLFKHFSILYENSVASANKANDLQDKFKLYTTSPSQVQVIKDAIFTMTFQYGGVAKRRLPGSIGPRGKYTSEYAVVRQNDQRFYTNGKEGVGTDVTVPEQSAWIYRWQVTDAVYEEVAVYGLRANYEVHRKKGFGAGPTDPELLIPIDREIMRTVSVRSREQVLSRGLHFFVSTAIKIKTPWYASGAFKIVMLVVAVIITIFSAGTAWQSIVAAAAVGTTALVITVITMIVGAMAIQYGVKLFVRKFGPKVGIIAAVAAMALGSYGASTNASWGEVLLSVGTNLATSTQSAYQDIVNSIQNDMEMFTLYAQGAFQDLADAKEQLGLNQQYIGLEPLEMVYRNPDIRLGEDPNDFYNRTVHSGNIGVTSYDLVEYFVDTKLTLPTLADIQMEEQDDGMAI